MTGQAFFVLTALADGPRHGYGIVGEVAELPIAGSGLTQRDAVAIVRDQRGTSNHIPEPLPATSGTLRLRVRFECLRGVCPGDWPACAA